MSMFRNIINIYYTITDSLSVLRGYISIINQKSEFIPLYTGIEVIDELVGKGEYKAQISLYRSNEFKSIYIEPPILDAFDSNGLVTKVNAEVRLLNGTASENIALQIVNCWATSTPSMTSLYNIFNCE